MTAAFALQLVQYLSAGAQAFAIVTGVYNKIEAIKARGRPPTDDELHAIAVDARALFLALPPPES